MSLPKKSRAPARFVKAPLAAAILALSVPLPVLAQGQLEEIIVTAQKREESLQNVPISIQTLNTKALEELGVNNFDDYTKMLPSISTQPSVTGVGFSQVYFRGVATGGDGQATLSQPSVSMYLDEMPITTIQGNLDIHMYDIARVEALAGPQGTLYGASSQAGTIRIITNKPDPSEFSASYSLEANQVDADDMGYTGEGYVNIPISDTAAVRIVGWKRKDAGFIDNVERSRTYPGRADTTADDLTVTNASFAEDNYNTIDTEGARASLRVDLNEDWTSTLTVMGQKAEADGVFGEDLSGFAGEQGDRQVSHIQDEFADDKFYQVGLTIEGHFGMFDLVYSGSYLNRNFNSSFDYSDYSYFYDVAYTNGYFAWINNSSTPGYDATGYDTSTRVWPGARYTNNDNYDRRTHEIRISTPQDKRLRGMIGYFYLNSLHEFEQHWLVEGLSSTMEMNALEPGGQQFPDTVYMNNMDRVDKDEAIFGQVQFDITDQLELSFGARHFKPETTVEGFFGFGLGFQRWYSPAGTPSHPEDPAEPGSPANGGDGAFVDYAVGWSRNGEWRCPSQVDYKDTPCRNVKKGIEESDEIYRVNLRYTINDDHMIYFTWSEGYRPGGINRNPFAGEFKSDFLTNWEFGWKTKWLDNSLQFNGAAFYEEWDDVQVGFQGANGITQNVNGPTANIYGTEMDLVWLPIDNLTLGASWALYESALDENYCEGCQSRRDINGDGDFNDRGESRAWAAKGDSLPYTPGFKGAMTARYTFPVGEFEGHVQAAVAYQGERDGVLNQRQLALWYGKYEASTQVDVTAGIEKESYAIEMFIKNLTDEDASSALSTECAPETCGTQMYGLAPRPRTWGVKWTQNF